MDILYTERLDTTQKVYLNFKKSSDLSLKIVMIKLFILDMLENNMLKKIVMGIFLQHQNG